MILITCLEKPAVVRIRTQYLWHHIDYSIHAAPLHERWYQITIILYIVR